LEKFEEVIACIGWGSLIWQPKNLPIESEWFHDGPVLPVEFARHSGQKSGEDKLSLVLLESGDPVTTRWAKLKVADVEEARISLRAREGCKLADIGFWPGGQSNEFEVSIGQWAKDRGIKGVVWTALPAKFANENGRCPTLEEALSFLSELSSASNEIAEEYVRMAPLVVRTPYRQAFETKLGWMPLARD
jgi:hypothetical protein